MIYGKKIRLRALEREDIPAFVRWFNDPEVRRHLLLHLPMSTAQEEKWFEEHVLNGANIILGIEIPDSKLIGNIGLHRANHKDSSAELGIVIGEKEYWSAGYGTDAIMTLLKFAFEELNLHRVYLRVDADNPRGIRCYEKCGFQHEGKMRDAVFRAGEYRDQLMMSVLRPEFEAQRREKGE